MRLKLNLLCLKMSLLSRLKHWRQKLFRFAIFLSLLKVEPFFFLLVFQGSLKDVPQSQLLQDKFCRNEYNRTIDFCLKLSKKQLDTSSELMKSAILKNSVSYGFYSTMISTFPSLFLSLFVGAWTDQYKHGRKLIMTASAAAMLIETGLKIILAVDFSSHVSFMLWAHLPFALVGGHMCFHIAAAAYITVTTPPRLRAIRFMLIELCIFIGEFCYNSACT